MLRDRLIDYRASVRDETEETVAAAIAELLGPDARYVVPAGLEPDWLPADSRGANRERITEPAVGHTGSGPRSAAPTTASASPSAWTR